MSYGFPCVEWHAFWTLVDYMGISKNKKDNAYNEEVLAAVATRKIN